MFSNGQEIWLLDHWLGEWLNCCPKCFDSYHNFLISGFISPSYLVFQMRLVKRFGLENGWTAAQSALILITTYLKFDIWMQFSYLFALPKFYLEKCCSNSHEILTVPAIFWHLTSFIGWRMVELLPKVLWFLSNLPEFWCRDAFLWFCLIFWHNFWLDGTIGIFWKENTFRIIFLICLIE